MGRSAGEGVETRDRVIVAENRRDLPILMTIASLSDDPNEDVVYQ
jgi:hypothetical protein